MNTTHDVHVVCDLETLATSPRATILSIGLASSTGDNYYAELPINEQGREISTSTLDWWDLQAAGEGKDAYLMARKQASLACTWEDKRREHREISTIAHEVANFLRTRQVNTPPEGKFYFWGNSPTFDQAILRNFLEQFEVEIPWDYWEELDVRTLRTLFGGKIKTVHHALQDAKIELQYVLQALQRVV